MSKRQETHITRKHIGTSQQPPKNTFWGFFALCVLVVYLFGLVTKFNVKEDAATFEVNLGSNNHATVYSAVVLRDEEIVYGSMDGYMNYYTKNGTRIGTGSIVCSMDRDGTFFQKLQDELEQNVTSLQQEDLQRFQETLKNIRLDFSMQNYSSIYADKYTLKAALLELINSTIYNEIATNAAGTTVFEAIRAESAGIVWFNYDHYESLTPEQITADTLAQKDYTVNQIAAGSYVEAGAPLYRMVHSEAFSIIFPLNDEDKLKYFLNETLTILFRDEDVSLTGEFSHYIGADGQRYGMVSFDGHGYSFMNKRYVDIQIAENYVEGMKIPTTAMVEKDCVKIPKSYVRLNQNSTKSPANVYKVINGRSEAFDVVVVAEEGDYYLVSADVVSIGDELKIINSENIEDAYTTYSVQQAVKVPGVYQVNRGYTIFRSISILCDTGDGFYICDPDIRFTISLYDQIVIDASKYTEGELIYQ